MHLPFSPGPNLSFVLTIFGLLLLYCEFIWMGRIVPGAIGALIGMAGLYWLWQREPTALGLGLIAAGVVCFVVEAQFKTYFMAAGAGIALLAFGFWKLFSHPPWIVAGLAFPVCCGFGAVTTWLLAVAKRARRNKRNLCQ